MNWSTFTANAATRQRKREATFRLFMRRTTKLAAIADPATGGNETLCRNWGNEESRRIWCAAWPRWQAYSGVCEARYKADFKTACDFERALRERRVA